MKLFISYGHGDYPDFFHCLINDLRNCHEIWVDQEIRLGDNWVTEIDSAIAQCDLFLFLKSKRSVRSESYCYGEITFAMEKQRRIAVISVDNVITPSIISNVQRFDMSQAINIIGEIDEEGYEEAFKSLLQELDRLHSQSFNHMEHYKLFSFDNRYMLTLSDRVSFLPEHILSRVEKWWNGKNVYMGIFGNAASGKSTLSAAVYKRISDSVIHFYRYSDLKTLDGKWYLQHIISSLADRCPEFNHELKKENFEKDFSTLNPEQLLLDYFIRPLQRSGKKALIILDGFDEIVNKGKRKDAVELFFGEEFRENRYGENVKIMITSRNDRELISLLISLGAEIISDYEQENLEIVKQIVKDFFNQHNHQYSEEIFKKIFKQSGGDFLYVKFIMEEINTSGYENISQIKFPLGMKGVCQRYFDRLFDDEDYFEEVVAPILEILVSVKTPISVEELQFLCQSDRRELRKLLKKLEMFVDVRNNCVTFVHKSLYDWLIANEIMDKYYIDCSVGQKKLCDYSLSELKSDHPGKYVCEYGLFHLLESDRYTDIVVLMQNHNQAFISVFLSFLIELISEKQYKKIIKIFKNYVETIRMNNFLTAESLRILVVFGREKEALRIVDYFCDLTLRQYYSDWVAFHVSKRNSASTYISYALANSLLEQTKEPIIAANLKRTIADIVREQGKYDEAQILYESVLSIAEENEFNSILFDCEFSLIDLLFVRGNLKPAWERLNSIKDKISSDGHSLDHFRYHRLRGHLFHIVGNIQDALNEHNESLHIAVDLHFSLKQMQAADSCAESAKNYEMGFPYLEICRRIYHETGLNRLEYGKSFYIESTLLLMNKEYQRAEETATQSIQILTEVGYSGGIAHAHLERGKARFYLGKEQEALSDLTVAVSSYKEKKSRPRFRFEAYAYLLKTAEKLDIVQDVLEMDDLSYFNINDYPFLSELYQYVETKRKDIFL